LISAVTAPVSAGFVPTSVTSTRKATITATAFNGGVYAALPRVKNDDILAHAFCSKDVFFDERYGFNLPHVKESREDFAAAGKTYTKSLILDDDIVTSVPRLANALMFRHYASKADAMDTTPVMAVTMRLFFKPPPSIKSDSLLVKDIVLPLDSTFGTVAAEMRASWQSPGNSKIPDSGFMVYDTAAPAVSFYVGGLPVTAEATVADVFRATEALEIRTTYAAETITRTGKLNTTRSHTDAISLHHAGDASKLPLLPESAHYGRITALAATAGLSIFIMLDIIFAAFSS